MKTSDFSFELPDDLIAQNPPEVRGTSRLMLLDRSTGVYSHHHITDFPSLVPEGALVVLNDSRVRKARVMGTRSDTGGSVEFLFIRKEASGLWQCMTSRAKRVKPGCRYILPGGVTAEIASRDGDVHYVATEPDIGEDYFILHGHVPLPPYMTREDSPADEVRYQTVYADKPGSVAAPTAGLHFTDDIMKDVQARGVTIARVTLHVGLGTFLPVRSETIEEHIMHEERYEISAETASLVSSAKKSGRPVVAVGTTSVRTLESAWKIDHLESGFGSTRIFMYPGYDFRVVDHLLTNFHTPESTLLMLVSAFAGRDAILAAYNEAVRQRYRFFSYGDAMFIR